MALEMKGSIVVDDDLAATGASDDDSHQQHQLHGDSSSLDASTGASADNGDGASSSPALFDEFYDDWAAFDHAVAAAIEKHHPIRKRSSLTFEVYNRTVSKGRHDRKSIAEFLSKTFKCTHGIKFRARGNGRRLRHKLRDIGCPFHVYASAVEFGATYRVKVRQQDKHNHPIGPDAIKNMPGLNDSDYDLGSENEATHAALTAAEVHHHHASAVPTSAEMDLQAHFAHAQAHAQAQAQAHAQSQAFAQAQAQVLLKAQHQAVAHAQELLNAQAQAQAQAQAHAQAQAQAQAHAQAQAQAQAHAHAQAQAHALLQAQVQVHDDILDAAGVHESEALLDSAIESTIGDDFPGTPKEDLQPPPSRPAKFEETTTLESIRRKMAHFAEERDWNQYHTPRNLVLALTGEVGELCEIFQWKGENKSVDDWTREEKVHLGEELSDVLLYLVRLADKCNVDLPTAVHDKMLKNARKYPADLVRGSSKKHNEYKRQRLDTNTTTSSTSNDNDSTNSNSTLSSHTESNGSTESTESALI